MTAFFITIYKIPSRKILIGLKIIPASQSAHLGRGQGERLISTLWLSVNDWKRTCCDHGKYPISDAYGYFPPWALLKRSLLINIITESWINQTSASFSKGQIYSCGGLQTLYLSECKMHKPPKHFFPITIPFPFSPPFPFHTLEASVGPLVSLALWGRWPLGHGLLFWGCRPFNGDSAPHCKRKQDTV